MQAPWFVRNSTLHSDFSLELIKEQIILISHNFFFHLPNITGFFYNPGVDNPYFLRLKNRYPLHSFLKCFSTFDLQGKDINSHQAAMYIWRCSMGFLTLYFLIKHKPSIICRAERLIDVIHSIHSQIHSTNE